MRRALQLLLIATVLGSTLVLSGCVVIVSQSSQQLNTIGAVRITTTACFSQQSGCPNRGNSNTATTSGGFQVLVGYRIPDDTSVPQAFSTTAGQPLSLSRDASYDTELERLSPAGAGQKWVGYRSAALATAPNSPTFTVSPTFALRQTPDGEPFSGPFDYQVVTGARTTPSNPNAAVDCGSNLAGSQATKTICVDSPAIGDLTTNLQQPTQDLGIVDDPSANLASRGKVEPVQFRVLYAGRVGSAPTFDLSASTDLPGGDASPRPANLTPTAGTARVRVNLQVPPDTTRGSYDVTLVATLPNGQTRSRTQEIQIGHARSPCGSAVPTITGTSGADRLVGTSRRDVISGYGGNDHILGRGGNDLICAGGGNDRVFGGAGNDVLAGRAGKDLLVGGHGHDLMIGGRGRDRFRH